ncbi:MAG: nuclear transport factor 2 family protein [Bacteroidota bacterium]
MTNLERATDLYNQVGQGRILEAFDQYYAENIVMEEPRGTREGKAACRASEEAFVASVEAFNGMVIKSIAEDAANNRVSIAAPPPVPCWPGGHL